MQSFKNIKNVCTSIPEKISNIFHTIDIADALHIAAMSIGFAIGNTWIAVPTNGETAALMLTTLGLMSVNDIRHAWWKIDDWWKALESKHRHDKSFKYIYGGTFFFILLNIVSLGISVAYMLPELGVPLPMASDVGVAAIVLSSAGFHLTRKIFNYVIDEKIIDLQRRLATEEEILALPSGVAPMPTIDPAEVAQLRADKTQLAAEVAAKRQQLDSLERVNAALNRQVIELRENITDRGHTINQQKETILEQSNTIKVLQAQLSPVRRPVTRSWSPAAGASLTTPGDTSSRPQPGFSSPSPNS